jgi:hypothetical protein
LSIPFGQWIDLVYPVPGAADVPVTVELLTDIDVVVSPTNVHLELAKPTAPPSPPPAAAAAMVEGPAGSAEVCQGGPWLRRTRLPSGLVNVVVPSPFRAIVQPHL